MSLFKAPLFSSICSKISPKPRYFNPLISSNVRLLSSLDKPISTPPPAEGRVALITGGAAGIGLEICRTFARDLKTRLIIADLNEKLAVQAATQLKSQGFQAIGVGCDVTSEKNIENAVNRAVSEYGRLDILVNNAGMQFISPIESFPSEKFEFLIKLMLISPFYSIKHCFPHFKRQQFGRVINVASINGLIGFAGKSAYNSAKHGVIGLTKVSALEGATHGITVNALCPGYVDTALVRNQMADLAKTRGVPLEKVLDDVLFPLIPQKRLLQVQEIADYAAFLASDKAAGVTGQACVLDGGYTVQ